MTDRSNVEPGVESTTAAPERGRWIHGTLPANVRVGCDTLVTAEFAFKRFRGLRDPGLVIGHHCTMDGVHFAVGEQGHVEIGDYCYFTNAVLLCEERLSIGSYVVIGWNATIVDTDFHPIAPAERIADAVACSPLGGRRGWRSSGCRSRSRTTSGSGRMQRS